MLEIQESSEQISKKPCFEENQSSEYILNVIYLDSDPTVDFSFYLIYFVSLFIMSPYVAINS